MDGVSRGPTDSILRDPRNTDVILLVMGLTGAGKSTFINKLFGQDVAKVNHDIGPEKTQIQHYFLSHPKARDRRLVIVDTPGFEEAPEEDLEILKRIASWLTRSYGGNYTLSGVIFLHEIPQARIRRATSEYLMVFNKLCGIDVTRNLILATTKWSEIIPERADRNGKRLMEEWNGLLQRGSQMCRFENTQSSARAIVNLILEQEAIHPNKLNPADITKDSGIMILLLGDTGVGKSTFINTAAGQTLADVNHDLTPSKELAVQTFFLQHPQHSTRQVIFVDTPGFDNYHARDDEVLKRIIDWLKFSCRSDASFGGILYLHDITKPRIQLTIAAFSVVELSCPEPASHVLITTAKWEKAQRDKANAERREEELKKQGWKKILDGGARTRRFMNTEDSAWDIVDTLLQADPLELNVIQQALNKIHTLMPKKVPKRKPGFFAASLTVFDRWLGMM